MASLTPETAHLLTPDMLLHYDSLARYVDDGLMTRLMRRPPRRPHRVVYDGRRYYHVPPDHFTVGQWRCDWIVPMTAREQEDMW